MVSMANTVVGVFDDYTEAEDARRELLESGFREQEVRISERTTSQPQQEPQRGGGGFWDSVRELFGGEEEDAAYYEEATRRGGAVVTVSASQDKLDTAVDIIEHHHPVDIDRKAEQWRKSGWQGPQRSAQQPGTSSQSDEHEQKRIPVAEEQLKVGKRKQQRGGVRIYSHTHEEPVEKDVEVREQHVDVKRQKADRPADDAAFEERTVEAAETREEPVVTKEARVTEEVVVDQDTTKRKEKVRDSVRKQQVDVEDAGKSSTPKGSSNRPGQQRGKTPEHGAGREPKPRNPKR